MLATQHRWEVSTLDLGILHDARTQIVHAACMVRSQHCLISCELRSIWAYYCSVCPACLVMVQNILLRLLARVYLLIEQVRLELPLARPVLTLLQQLLLVVLEHTCLTCISLRKLSASCVRPYR